jgi:hypothetical protein
MDEREEYRVRETVTEIIKLSFDNLKHLTTLNAGSIVLIATFLKDIFPGVKGTLDVGPGIKLLVTASFICFGASLALSVYLMHIWARTLEYLGGHGRAMQLEREHDRAMQLEREELPEGLQLEKGTERYRRALQRSRRIASVAGGWPLSLFAIGLICFGIAVVLNLYQ